MEQKKLTEKKETIWGKLAEKTSPSVINAFTGEIGFMMPYMKISIKEGDINAVYTDSNLYPDMTNVDLDLLVQDLNAGIKEIATNRGWKKIKSLREQILLNESRGAFKRVLEKKEELHKQIAFLRRLKHSENLIK